MAAPDWLVIEAEYKAGKKSVNSIATEHGISEGTIRARAKKLGWVRDAVGTVRKQVSEHIAGIANGVTNATVRKMMDEAAKSGIADMEYGLSNSRKILYQVSKHLSVDDDILLNPRHLKTLNEANAGAVETIRRIRQLDEPAQKTLELTGFRMVVE